MAKKVVATLKKEGGKQWAKVVKSVKTEKGSYTFKEVMIPVEEIQEFFKK